MKKIIQYISLLFLSITIVLALIFMLVVIVILPIEEKVKEYKQEKTYVVRRYDPKKEIIHIDGNHLFM